MTLSEKNNNVTRFLSTKNISFETHEFQHEKLSAIEVANLLNVEPEQVFKSIVCTRIEKGKPIVAIVPANFTVDLKKLAKLFNEKKLKPATHDEAERLTGLKTGGISPLALLNKGFEFAIDETCQVFDQIFLSAGERGLQVKLSPLDLIDLIQAQTADIIS